MGSCIHMPFSLLERRGVLLPLSYPSVPRLGSLAHPSLRLHEDKADSTSKLKVAASCPAIRNDGEEVRLSVVTHAPIGKVAKWSRPP